MSIEDEKCNMSIYFPSFTENETKRWTSAPQHRLVITNFNLGVTLTFDFWPPESYQVICRS